MDIDITATGTPGNVGQDIQKQLKSLPDDVRKAWPATLAAIRDDVAKQLQQRGGEQVQATLHITFDVTSTSVNDVLRDLASGDLVPVPSESPSSRRRATSDASAAGPASPVIENRSDVK